MVSYQWKGGLGEVTQLVLDHSVSCRDSLSITPGALHFTHSDPCHEESEGWHSGKSEQQKCSLEYPVGQPEVDI